MIDRYNLSRETDVTKNRTAVLDGVSNNICISIRILFHYLSQLHNSLCSDISQYHTFNFQVPNLQDVQIVSVIKQRQVDNLMPGC